MKTKLFRMITFIFLAIMTFALSLNVVAAQSNAVTSTCTATGLTEEKHCSICNEVLVTQQVVDVLEHSMTETVAKAASCMEDGTKGYFYCGTCQKYFEDQAGNTETTVADRVIDKLGHTGDWSVETSPTYDTPGELKRICSICSTPETILLPVISVENGYVQKYTGVMTRWHYTHEGNDYIFDIAENNDTTDNYSFGAEAWYMSVSDNDIPTGVSGFKSTDADWNSTDESYSGNDKTYTTTIVVEESTAVTLLLKCAENTFKPFFATDSSEHVLSNILVNGRADRVTSDTTAEIGAGGEYNNYEVATIFLEAGTNTITFKTADGTNFQGIGFQSTEPITLAQDKVDLKLMSFNIRNIASADTGVKAWRQRKDAFVQNLLTRNPDVVCFQEIEESQSVDIAAGLTGYEVVWYPRRSGDSEGSGVAYKTDIWEEQSRRVFWLSDTPDTQSKYATSGYYRICVNVLLQHKESGQYLNVYSVHLDNTGNKTAAAADELRKKQMQAVLDQAALTEYPTYIAGDFNCRSNSQAYMSTAELYRDCQVFAPVTDSGATYQGWGKVADDADTPIDFCFVSGEHFVANTFEICRDKWGANNANLLSDHYAIMTNVFLLVNHVHTEVVDAAVEVTCTTAGETEGKHCSTCGKVLTAQEEIPAPGHTEVIDAAVEATCTTAGKTEGTHCSVCQEVLVAQEDVDKLGHVYDDDNDTDCNRCSATRVPGCSHENKVPVGEAKEATCTEDGMTAGEKCAACGEVFAPQQTLPRTGHNEVADVAKAATCTETGLTEGKHCSVCSQVIVAQEETNVLGHSYAETPAIIDPTISEPGKISYECTRDNCDETEDIRLPHLNTTDYTTVTTGSNSTVSPVVVTTTFTLNSTEVEYAATLESDDYVSVDLGNGSVSYSRYELAKLCNDDMIVTYDTEKGYTFHAVNPCTLTHISVYGHDLTMTGTWNINSSKRIEIHDGNLYIGTDEKPAYVTVTAVGDNYQHDTVICLKTGEDLTVATGSTLSLNSIATGNYPTRLLSAYNASSSDYSMINIYGTLIGEEESNFEVLHIFMQQYHQLTVYEGGTVQCDVVHIGKNNTVNISGTMTATERYTQKDNSVLTISETGSVQVNSDITATNSTLKVNGGKLTVYGKIAACKTFTVTGLAEVVITGTSAKIPSVPAGASVTINGKTY